MEKHQHTRRIFLRGLGGAAVLAPFLGSVGHRRSWAQSTEVAYPRRLVLMFTHYGCLTDEWFPDDAHGPLSPESFAGKNTEPLGPLASKLLLPRGIRAMNEWTEDMTLGQGNALHYGAGSFLSCQPLSPNSDDPFTPLNTSQRFQPKPIGPSLDHVCAQQLSSDRRPFFLRVGGAAETAQSAISYSGPEESFPGIGSVAQAMSFLTGLFGSAAKPSPDTYRAMRGQRVLDLVRDDLQTLERFDMSASDRQKLDSWKELVNQLVVPAERSVCSEESAIALGLSKDHVDAASLSGVGQVDRVTQRITDQLDVADLYSNLAVLAALCDANRAMVLKYPGPYVYRGLGLDLDSHAISHRVGSAEMGGECVQGALEQIRTIDRYYASKFAHLVQTLDSVPEGDGTVLDNCAAVWFQEMSDGNAHNLNNLPIVQAGSCGGVFKTGVSVNVEDGEPNLSRGNSTRYCRDENDVIPQGEVNATETPPGVGNAPINKYFCNLMNAVGVRADETGFPTVGGTQPVTHFGRYDRTEDFVGGDVNPPLISDPGSFEDLLD